MAGLVVIDRERRAYAGLSRDGEYYHLIGPAHPLDLRVADGRRQAGQLVCSCQGGMVRGTCYRTLEAEAIEDAAEAPAWMREIAAETELEKAAARG